jgi:hypothetical protein
MSRPSWRSSLLGHPSAEIFSANGKDFLFLLFLPGGATCGGPQRSRARRFLARRKRTLDGEGRCETISQGGRACSPAHNDLSTTEGR